MESIIVLVSSKLQRGIAASLTQFVYSLDSEIIDYDQYVDSVDGRFYARVEWVDKGNYGRDEINTKFKDDVASLYNLDWQIKFSDQKLKLAVFVSHEMAHLYAILLKCISKQWPAVVSLIVSNHDHLENEAKRFDIDYYHIPIDKNNKQEQEKRQLAILDEYNIDLVILARYMQILSSQIISPYKNRLINIHHSMLPAFHGAKPYHQAYARGVKLIGATSHYVTEDLDAGPIISQDVIHVDHRKNVTQLINSGRDLETLVLTRAVELHVNFRVLVTENRTVIFD